MATDESRNWAEVKGPVLSPLLFVMVIQLGLTMGVAIIVLRQLLGFVDLEKFSIGCLRRW